MLTNTVQEGEAEDLTLKLDSLKKREKERIRRIKTLEQEISRTEEELAKPPDVKLEKEEDLAAEAVGFGSFFHPCLCSWFDRGNYI